jgi:hypothetical protein
VTEPERFTLTIPHLSLHTAQTLSEAIDSDFDIDARALTINEAGDECWDLIAYFESKAEAEKARAVLAQEAATIDPVPDLDWMPPYPALASIPITSGVFTVITNACTALAGRKKPSLSNSAWTLPMPGRTRR